MTENQTPEQTSDKRQTFIRPSLIRRYIAEKYGARCGKKFLEALDKKVQDLIDSSANIPTNKKTIKDVLF